MHVTVRRMSFLMKTENKNRYRRNRKKIPASNFDCTELFAPVETYRLDDADRNDAQINGSIMQSFDGFHSFRMCLRE